MIFTVLLFSLSLFASSKEEMGSIPKKPPPLTRSDTEPIEYPEKETFTPRENIEYGKFVRNQYTSKYHTDFAKLNPKGYFVRFADIPKIPVQGWKLHVGAKTSAALKIVKALLPFLIEKKYDFKIINSLGHLAEFNNSPDSTQKGKFITIYPRDDDQALAIVKGLDFLLIEGFSPEDFTIPLYELPLGESGAITTRYGLFKKTMTVSGLARTAQLKDAAGNVHPDNRKTPVPSFIKEHPFGACLKDAGWKKWKSN